MEETKEYTWEKRYRALVEVLEEEFSPWTVAKLLGKMNQRIEG